MALTEKSQVAGPETQRERGRIRALTVTVVVLAVALIGLGAWVVYDQTVATSDVPFLLHGSGVATFEPGSVDPVTGEPCSHFGGLATLTEATGTATYLGDVEVVGGHCTPEAEEPVTGQMALVAESGDELVIQYNGPIDMTMTANAFKGVYDMTFIGDLSTGEFENAEGSGSLTVVATFENFDDPVWPAEFWFDGSVDY